ncbi:hypothetical protein OH77DRAFT_1584415 [Trametes cingulata]|nr:hypothetical protein OH77DRAFT_1584415 [Trametes cingulata]
MATPDLEAGPEEVVPLTSKSSDGVMSRPDPGVVEKTAHDAPGSGSSPLDRLTAFGRKLQTQATTKALEIYPRALDMLRRTAKLIGLSFALIFVVMMASFFMALSHWFTIVFGHFVLRYILPSNVDETFVRCRIDMTMLLAGVGAFVVNVPPFIVFLLSFPLTFDRTVLEGSAAPANEFIKRITPKNRYALVFLKYAPRLAAGPIGSVIFILLSGEDNYYSVETLDPLHAFIAGVGGEAALTALGFIRVRVMQKWRKSDPVDKQGGKNGEEVLPLSRTA